MNRRMVKIALSTLACVAGLAAILVADGDQLITTSGNNNGQITHVLLLSVDGLHAGDLERFVATHPVSALGVLTAFGRTYTHATATMPSDSFPGLLAMVTGGTPRSTGVYYDDGYDRTLAAANAKPAPDPSCVGGTRVQWKQNLDVLPFSFTTTIDPAKLPRDPADGCTTLRVYPHQFPRMNNVFELVKAAGGRTAWSDKHPAYEFLNGPSGTGVDDLYTPEITLNPPAITTTNSFALTMAYDDMKVAAIINEINGLDSTGTNLVGVPAVFGMNFQAVSVGQKLKAEQLLTALPLVGGYVKDPLTGALTPSDGLQATLEHTDASIGAMVVALIKQRLLDNTLIIISAKHGNSPIDPATLVRVNPAAINNIVNIAAPGSLAQVSADTGPMIWLKDSPTATVGDALPNVVNALLANREMLNLPPDDPATVGDEAILSGAEVAAFFGVSPDDARVPDIVLRPIPGTVYTTSGSKIADHGGFGEDDVHVALLVWDPSTFGQLGRTIDVPVETRQIACTILRALGTACNGLDSQRSEPSKPLPKR
jgi:hypothetical protein